MTWKSYFMLSSFTKKRKWARIQYKIWKVKACYRHSMFYIHWDWAWHLLLKPILKLEVSDNLEYTFLKCAVISLHWNKHYHLTLTHGMKQSPPPPPLPLLSDSGCERCPPADRALTLFLESVLTAARYVCIPQCDWQLLSSWRPLLHRCSTYFNLRGSIHRALKGFWMFNVLVSGTFIEVTSCVIE